MRPSEIKSPYDARLYYPHTNPSELNCAIRDAELLVRKGYMPKDYPEETLETLGIDVDPKVRIPDFRNWDNTDPAILPYKKLIFAEALERILNPSLRATRVIIEP